MPFFKSFSKHAGPRTIFTKYPEIYRPWSDASQAIMNGPSELSPGERELILAFAAAAGGCEFVHVAHSEVAYAWGIAHGLVERLIADFDAAPLDERMRPLLAFVRKLMVTPSKMTQGDADAVFAAGWSENALSDAIAVTARAAFMQRLVEGHGFIPLTREEAAKRGEERVKLGYVDIFPEFRKSN